METFTTGKCSILIYSNSVSVDEISAIMQIKPTHSVCKGELLSKNLNTYSPHNGWFYDVLCRDLESINKPLQEISRLCLEHINDLNKLKDIDIKLRCFINTELAQVGFGISSETLSLLASVDKEFEITLFSWGGVEVDSE